jgi:hypothetical protein
MNTSYSTLDLSTYSPAPMSAWGGADETTRADRQERKAAALLSALAGLAVTALHLPSPPVGQSGTRDDYSAGSYPLGASGSFLITNSWSRPAPLPFIEAYSDMLSLLSNEEGWDGVESKPVSRKSVERALDFLSALPPDVPKPEASASSDGTVDWYWRAGSSAATVTFFETGNASYFSVTPAGSVKGKFKASGSIPDELISSLRLL